MKQQLQSVSADFIHSHPDSCLLFPTPSALDPDVSSVFMSQLLDLAPSLHFQLNCPTLYRHFSWIYLTHLQTPALFSLPVQ